MDADRPAILTSGDHAATIRAAGLRATRPRRLVLGVLAELGGHLTVEEMTSALRERGRPLPRGTVYNVVGDLSTAGVIMVADAGPGSTLYEVAERWHHHFVCRHCGAVVDVPCVVGDRPCLDAALDGAHVDEAQVIFRGRCARCAA